MHRWETTLFETNVEYGKIKGCAQHWECLACGAKFIGSHGDKPHSDINCHDEQKRKESLEAFKQRIPVAWGNGKKARGGQNGTGGRKTY